MVVLRKERPIGLLLLGAGVAWRLMRMKEKRGFYALTIVVVIVHASDVHRIVRTRMRTPPRMIHRLSSKNTKKVTAQHGRRKAATRIVHGAGSAMRTPKRKRKRKRTSICMRPKITDAHGGHGYGCVLWNALGRDSGAACVVGGCGMYADNLNRMWCGADQHLSATMGY